MRDSIKLIVHLLSQILALPLVILCKLEELLISRTTDIIFQMCAQTVALVPGLPGVILRRGFYSLTLDYCSRHCYIGFGTFFSHRAVTVEKHVYIGSYTIIGSAHLGEHSLIGSRASILSGKELHSLGEDGRWTPYSPDKVVQVKISKNVWIGEGAIIAADIGEGSMVGAGSVVMSDTRSHILVTGNPARFVNKLGKSE
jgi:acetyltransferase-like isoleucine patch superfamily enzyme